MLCGTVTETLRKSPEGCGLARVVEEDALSALQEVAYGDGDGALCGTVPVTTKKCPEGCGPARVAEEDAL